MAACFHCGVEKRKEDYCLCGWCRQQLPFATQLRLTQWDEKTRDRQCQLRDALRRGVPLAEVEVAA